MIFSRGNGEILRTYQMILPKFHLILPKFHLIPPKNFFFPPEEIGNSSGEIQIIGEVGVMFASEVALPS